MYNCTYTAWYTILKKANLVVYTNDTLSFLPPNLQFIKWKVIFTTESKRTSKLELGESIIIKDKIKDTNFCFLILTKDLV